MEIYEARFEEPLYSHLHVPDKVLVTPDAPSGGPVLHMIMGLIDSTSYIKFQIQAENFPFIQTE